MVRRLLPYLGTFARLVLGGVWIAAGLLKVGDLAASGRSVVAYRLLPYPVATTLGAVLPFVEIGLGLLLVLGLATRLAAILSAVLQIAFIIGIVSAWARGLRIDCGCFGSGGDLAANQQPTYFSETIRDIATANRRGVPRGPATDPLLARRVVAGRRPPTVSKRDDRKKSSRMVRDQLAAERRRRRTIWITVIAVAVLVFGGLIGWGLYQSDKPTNVDRARPAPSTTGAHRPDSSRPAPGRSGSRSTSTSCARSASSSRRP